jgi:branched-chain amino acid transport system ATP-binding protein
MAEPALAIDGLVKRFGGLVASDRVSLAIPEGELHAVIGPNGAGKTTLIAQLAGGLMPDGGEIRIFGRRITHLSPHARVWQGLARSFQITSLFLEFTALENVMRAVQARIGHGFRFFRPTATDRALTEPARACLERVGLADRADVVASTLAHGEQRRLEIAMALASEPKVLLLDEPMAGAGPEESAAIVALLGALKGKLTVLLVEHDMDAVFQLADRISVLVYGRIIATGTPEAIRANAEVQQAYLGEDGAE